MKECLCVCASMCSCWGGDPDRLLGPGASQEEPNHQSERHTHTHTHAQKTRREVHARARGGFQLQPREENHTVKCLTDGLPLLQYGYFNIKALGSPQKSITDKVPPTDCSLVCFGCTSGIPGRGMRDQTRCLQYIQKARSINQQALIQQQKKINILAEN